MSDIVIFLLTYVKYLIIINYQTWMMVQNKAVLCLEVVIYKRLQIWRHNYVISRNEYVIFTFSESTIP